MRPQLSLTHTHETTDISLTHIIQYNSVLPMHSLYDMVLWMFMSDNVNQLYVKRSILFSNLQHKRLCDCVNGFLYQHVLYGVPFERFSFNVDVLRCGVNTAMCRGVFVSDVSCSGYLWQTIQNLSTGNTACFTLIASHSICCCSIRRMPRQRTDFCDDSRPNLSVNIRNVLVL